METKPESHYTAAPAETESPALRSLRERRERHERLRRDARRGNLRLRNALNTIFILMAVAAMVGVAWAAHKGGSLTPWYATALAAVLVKMVEVVLRIPSMRK